MSEQHHDQAPRDTAGHELEHVVPARLPSEKEAALLAEMKRDWVSLKKQHGSQYWMAYRLTLELIQARSVSMMDLTPPVMFLDLVLKPEDALDVRANLDDLMIQWTARHGYRKAARIYKLQACRIACRTVFDSLISKVERVVKLVRLGL